MVSLFKERNCDMKKIKKIPKMIFVCLMLFLCIGTTSTTKIQATSYGEFHPVDSGEIYVGHTPIGSWNGGSFFETVTQQYVGYNANTKQGIFRFRYYITQSGSPSSYTYMATGVGVYVDENKIGEFYNPSAHISNQCVMMGEISITLSEGVHKVELRDTGSGAITVVNISVNVPFNIRKFAVNFINADGTLLKSQQVPLYANATPPSNPSMAGHTFTGWNGDYTNVNSNRTIIATYNINSYTVAFNSNGGSNIPTQTIQYGNRASPPINPIRGSDKFMGWYIDSSLSNKYDFNATVSSSFTLYAKWNLKPTIQAPDITILENMYTSDEWNKIRLESVKSMDTEDGDITNKVTVIYDNTDITKKGTYQVIYQVIDSVGNVATKEIKVNVFDGVLEEDKTEKRIRSISNQYLNTLNANSIWKLDSNLSNVLTSTLQKSNDQAKKTWKLSTSDIEKIKEFNRTHDNSQASNALFLQKFGHLKK